MNVEVGDTFTKQLVEDLKRTRIVQYAGASGDYNPIHTDEVFATQVAGYPSVFAHGMLTMGMTGTLLTETFGHEQIAYYGVRFSAQVWPGDDLTATATVTAVRDEDGQRQADLEVVTTNQDGTVVLAGQATVKLD